MYDLRKNNCSGFVQTLLNFHTPFTWSVSLFAYSSLSLKWLSTSSTLLYHCADAAFTNCLPDLYFLLPTAMRVCVYACLRLSTACIIEVDLLGICPVSGALHRVGSWGVLLARAGPTAVELSEGV